MKRLIVTVLAGGSALLAMASENVRTPKAVMFMLDGCRADALMAARTPNIDRLLSGKWQPGYRCAWSFSGLALADARPSSAANHVALATGVNAARSHVWENGQIKNGAYTNCPCWLTRVVAANPARKALFAFSWWEDGNLDPRPNVKFLHGSDASNAVAVPKLLAAPDGPDATMFFIDLPDHGGHGAGFYPFTAEYMNTIHVTDRYIGGVLDAIASHPTFASEDWLVIVNADHGGYARSHGMWGGQASTIPLIVAGLNVPSGRLVGAPRHYDLTMMALRHFGIDAAALKLDGQMPERAEQPVSRPLREGLSVYLPFSEKSPTNAVARGPVPVRFGARVASGARGGFIGGCLSLNEPTNSFGGVRLEGSERLAFANGSDFAVTLWVRLPSSQRGDAPIFANKDWNSGANPGVVLVSSRQTENARAAGVCLNAAVPGPRRRVDMGTLDVEPGKWTFYAVTHRGDGVLSVYQGAPDGRLYWICERVGQMDLGKLPFQIGQDGTGRYPFTLVGDVDEFALWTRSLDETDIRSVFEAGLNGIELGELTGLSR